MTSSRISAAALRAGLASLAAGLVVIAAAQVLAPLDRPPLYDGVVVEEPYRYLAPGPGQAGDPTSYAGTEPVIGPASPAFAAATAEGPPQAQLIAQAGAFSIPEEATGMAVTIMPVAPEPPGAIPGNAYRFSVTDEAGAPVPVATGSFVTLLLRAPTGLTEVTIVQLVDGGWTRFRPCAPASPTPTTSTSMSSACSRSRGRWRRWGPIPGRWSRSSASWRRWARSSWRSRWCPRCSSEARPRLPRLSPNNLAPDNRAPRSLALNSTASGVAAVVDHVVSTQPCLQR